MAYKVGDKVRIVDHRADNMNHSGEMDKWLGKVMTIRECSLAQYRMKEDYGEYNGYGWQWDDSMISGLVEPRREPCTVELRFDGMIHGHAETGRAGRKDRRSPVQSEGYLQQSGGRKGRR